MTVPLVMPLVCEPSVAVVPLIAVTGLPAMIPQKPLGEQLAVIPATTLPKPPETVRVCDRLGVGLVSVAVRVVTASEPVCVPGVMAEPFQSPLTSATVSF